MSVTTPIIPKTPAALWRIVLARDRRYDGHFVYAVRSTGVYCRPSCPSRRPRRESVAFFHDPRSAEQSGFRPCRRCRPAEPDAAGELVRRACAIIDGRTEEAWSLKAVASEIGTTTGSLGRAFQRVLGVTPRQYWDSRRLVRLKSELKEKTRVSTALYQAGYSGSSRVYEDSDARLGMTPATYARGGAGAHIAFTVVKSPLGQLLVAATPRGICRVAFGDDDAALERALIAEFPAAAIERDDQQLAALTRDVLGLLDRSPAPVDLPLDVLATAFQRRVWEALKRIPHGTTRSYTEVARTIGYPAAVRAVARACATNPVALVVPCHRVVREDGELGGYRWGLERKKELLGREAKGKQARRIDG